ncbi:MAG: putative Fe-S cluster assembly protein SufT [Gammaproteobacteria bacterium]|nr:MAG: putative Fe-S cluster assembly protein SufT [Gammaproteobacteria bacterium]
MTHEREVVLTKRDIEARIIPAGTEIIIPADTFVTITQSLGGTYTVVVNGNLARIEAKDADGLGKESAYKDFEPPEDGTVDKNQIWEALKSVYDPEIPINIVDLGLIYDCAIVNDSGLGNKVSITMTLTSPGCGMGPLIADDVKQRVEHVPNVDLVEINLVFDPPWNNDRLSDEAKLELGLL